MRRLLMMLPLCFLMVFTGCGNSTPDSSKPLDPSQDVTIDKTAVETKKVRLNSGYDMPVIGLGTWTLNNGEAEEAVYTAIKCGYRLIDTARYYDNETGVGKGIRKAIDEGLVKREDIFVTSKIMPASYGNPAHAIEESLARLNIGYIDLMLIHQPGSNDKAVYHAMEEAVRTGKLRSIGISNYYSQQAVDEVLSYAAITPAVIQNENHIYYQNNKLRDYVKAKGIVIESWYPLGGRGHIQDILSHPTVMAIAKTHQKTSAQVILKWQVQSGYAAVPGSRNPRHIAENIAIGDFRLTEEEMKSIQALNQDRRYESW
ncbi:MAG: aldo/keto reductase [Oxalobacter sp.]|nr:aldo/keto reductase [Oxalobacter sp.]